MKLKENAKNEKWIKMKLKKFKIMQSNGESNEIKKKY